MVNVLATTEVEPTDGLAHVRFVVAPVLQNPNHTTTQQPYYFLHVKNLTTGEELFNRFNYVSQAGVPWQSDAGGSIEYLAWQAIDVAAPGLINVGDDVQAQVIAAGCSLGGHWGEAYVDAFGAFLPGLSATKYLTDSTAISYADYSVSIDDGVTAVTAAQALTYTIVVRNNGPATPTKKNGTVASVPVVETNSTGGLALITWTCV